MVYEAGFADLAFEKLLWPPFRKAYKSLHSAKPRLNGQWC